VGIQTEVKKQDTYSASVLPTQRHKNAATCSNTQQHAATRSNTQQHAATCSNTQQHAATRSNTQQQNKWAVRTSHHSKNTHASFINTLDYKVYLSPLSLYSLSSSPYSLFFFYYVSFLYHPSSFIFLTLSFSSFFSPPLPFFYLPPFPPPLLAVDHTTKWHLNSAQY
jgi:hypothetical protein